LGLKNMKEFDPGNKKGLTPEEVQMAYELSHRKNGQCVGIRINSGGETETYTPEQVNKPANPSVSVPES